jgi:transcription termination factor Rho
VTTTLEHPITRSESRTSHPSHPSRTSRQPAPAQALPQPVTGLVDLQDQRGFLRVGGYLSGPEDLSIPAELIRRYDLRSGDLIEGAAAPRTDTLSGRTRQVGTRLLARVDLVNGAVPDQSATRPRFAEMTPVHPQDRLLLETDPGVASTRIMDLLTPIGKGQRGLIVAPPKTGKTMLLQAIAKAVTRNHPACHLMVVLLDERPEEVTDMRRSVQGEVIASTFDRPVHEHIAIAELAVERAKRLAEQGTDVVILLDSLTRLCRAHNNNARPGGRTLSGGVDAAAVAKPKQLFGAARNLEEGGSVTILATALIDTGSRADDYFFEELKSTGNMELRLDRSLADKRIHPAIDLTGSGTRREELLMAAEELDTVRRLRRVLGAQPGDRAIELLLERMKQTGGNTELLLQIRRTTPSLSGS